MIDGARDHYITLDGLRFHYREWGDATRPPLVILHGFTMHARDFDRVASLLAATYRVLVLDQRGHGETDWAPDYAAGCWVRDVAAFADALALARFALAGHSLGGLYAVLSAARYPARVSRLIVEDVGPLAPEALDGSVTCEIFADPEEMVRAVLPLDPNADEDQWRHHVRHTLIPRAEGGWERRWDRALRQPGPHELLPPIDEQWAALRSIACPALVMRGERSPFTHQLLEATAEALPKGRYVEIPHSRHNIHWGNPAAFVDAIRDFLREEAAGAPRERRRRD